MKKLFFITSLLAAPMLLVAQSGGLDPADILKPLSDQWTSYSGDMTGQALQRAEADQHPDGEESEPGSG